MCEAQRAQNEKTTVRQNCGTCTRGTSSTALDSGCGLAVIGNDHADIEETDKKTKMVESSGGGRSEKCSEHITSTGKQTKQTCDT